MVRLLRCVLQYSSPNRAGRMHLNTSACSSGLLLYQVGFDPCNRNGTGGNPTEVLELASDICHAGWSWQETRHATCVEVMPHDSTVETFNMELCGSGSGLAPVIPQSILYGSLACGHTNMGLRAIAAGVSTTNELMSENGRFSLERLRARDAEFARAVEQGLRWKVLRWEVRRDFPKALDVIQVRCRKMHRNSQHQYGNAS